MWSIVSFLYRDDVRKNFLSLSDLEREELLALSCFESAHWELGPAWDIDRGNVEDRILKYLEILYGDKWQTFKNKGNPRSMIISNFYSGEMVNEFLKWHIEDKTEYQCVTEDGTNSKQFDLQIQYRDNPKCDVGIKRIAKTGNMSEYLEEYCEKVDEVGESPTNLVLNLYPVSDRVHPDRARDFLVGYGFMSELVDERYGNNNYWVANLPAHISPTEEHLKPLQQVEKIIKERLQLSGY